MRVGVDTDFLVAVEQTGHPYHRAAYQVFQEQLDRGSVFVLTPQVMAEFLHVITDGRRFAAPMPMAAV